MSSSSTNAVRLALIADGVVTNVIVAASAADFPHAIESATASPGDDYVGGEFVRSERPKTPQPLDEAALIDLCQSAGGMTDAQLVSAFNDPQLAAFWIKLRAASVILPTDQRTLDGLAAVDALGYLPQGAQAVLDAWPAA